MERTVRPGEFYRHFKNKLYQIIAIAVHSETGERMVVYQALYGTYQTYVRPYEMFVSEVDHEKYPEVTQRYRFERVEPTSADTGEAGTAAMSASVHEGWKIANIDLPAQEIPETPDPNPAFLKFLEADTYEQRMEYLEVLSRTIRQEELDSIYLVLDMKPEQGSLAEQVQAVRRFLTMQNHFDGNRLR